MNKTRIIISNISLVNLQTQEEFRVFGEMVFGRTSGDKTFPEDLLMSKKHFRLISAESGVMIEDFASTNHTKVNGKKLKANTVYKLRSRDIIQFGKQQFQISIVGKIVGGDAGETANETMADVTGQAPPTQASRIIVESTEMKSEVQDDRLELLAKGKSAWYLQFEGSEFGPMVFSELANIVKNPNLKDQELFVLTEGLTEWAPVSASHKIFQEATPAPKAAEVPPPQAAGILTEVPLAAKVSCFFSVRGLPKKVPATCASIGLAKISILCEEVIEPDSLPFEIEVVPWKTANLGQFRAVVKIERALENFSYTLALLDYPPEVKAYISEHLPKN